MGKKILTEAGYEVVAVSNGAAAVKKIAEQKPDIIILDVYMPGYSGLEVCEKVRGSAETMKTPVLLTVGKLEPYKPEDANRVKADGVIVKPFEASDLLAIVKKFEERLVQVPVLVPQPTRAERVKEEEVARPVMEPVEHTVTAATFQPMVEVPDHMATTAAFSDLLGTEPPHPANHFDPVPLPVMAEAPAPVVVERPSAVVVETPPSMVIETPAPVVFEAPIAVAETPAPVVLETPAPTVVGAPAPIVVATPVPEAIEELASDVLEAPIVAAPVRPSIADYELPASWREPQPREAEIAEIPVTAAAEVAPPIVELEPEPLPPPPPPPPPVASRPLQIPVYQESEPAEIAYELMPTSAPPLGEIELPREPELQETAAEATRSTIADTMDPSLLTAVQQFEPIRASADAITKAEMAPLDEAYAPPAGYQDIPAEIVAHHPLPPPPPPPPVAAEVPRVASARAAADPVTDSDFEARVAAALAAYGHNNQEASAEANHAPVAGLSATSAETSVPPPPMPTIPRFSEAESDAADAAGVSATAEAFLATREPAEEVQVTAVDSETSEDEDAERYLSTAEAAANNNESLQVSQDHGESATEQPDHEWASAEISAVPEPLPSAFESPMPVSNTRVALVASVEDALPGVVAEAAVTANADAGADHQAIAKAVHRVMERLKPELVEEILRELNSKKE
jgi:CheY-like chemotaxis protein